MHPAKARTKSSLTTLQKAGYLRWWKKVSSLLYESKCSSFRNFSSCAVTFSADLLRSFYLFLISIMRRYFKRVKLFLKVWRLRKKPDIFVAKKVSSLRRTSKYASFLNFFASRSRTFCEVVRTNDFLRNHQNLKILNYLKKIADMVLEVGIIKWDMVPGARIELAQWLCTEGF